MVVPWAFRATSRGPTRRCALALPRVPLRGSSSTSTPAHRPVLPVQLRDDEAPDYDVADAFVALCTAILHAEGACRPVFAADPVWQEQLVKEWEEAIWVPTITTCAPV